MRQEVFDIKRKFVPVVTVLVVLLSFFVVKGVRQGGKQVERNRLQRNVDWLERCQKIQIGMSYDDVVKTLGIPEALSQGNAGEDVMMMYKPPYPGFKTNPTSALGVSEFLVDIKDGKVTYYTLGYE